MPSFLTPIIAPKTYQVISERPVIVFGAPNMIQMIILFLKFIDADIEMIVDNDDAKWGKTVDDISIAKPEKRNLKGKTVLIASKPSFQIIGEQLKEWGFKAGKDFFSFFYFFEEEIFPQKDFVKTFYAYRDQYFMISDLFHSKLTDSAVRNIHIFYVWQQYFNKNNFSFEGKNIVELGFGNSIVPALMTLLAGARHATVVERMEKSDIYKNKQYREMVSYLAVYGLDGQGGQDPDAAGQLLGNFGKLVQFTPYRVHFDKERLTILNAFDIEQLPNLNTAFDVMVSNVVLEHCTDPEKVLESMSECVSPGAVAFHSIDFSDHSGNEIPGFYYQSRDGYRQKNRNLNTWRLGEWLRGFVDHGWEIMEVEQVELLKKEDLSIGMLHEDYQDFPIEDLVTMHAFIVMKFRG